MDQRSVLLWNLMIRASVQEKDCKKVLQLFSQMQLEGLFPNKFTFLYVLSALASQSSLAAGKWMHTLVLSCGLGSDVTLGTALVKMYGKIGSVEDAWISFDGIPTSDAFSWTSIIAVYAEHRLSRFALQLFGQMQQEAVMPDKVTYVNVLAACGSQAELAQGKRIHAWTLHCGFVSDIVFGNALLNMYGKCGNLDDAQRIFDEMHNRDVVSWTAIITAHCRNGQVKAVFDLFDKMLQEGIVPDKVTFLTALDVCANKRALLEGKRLHSIIEDIGLEANVAMRTALVNMYGKCGSIEYSRSIFDNMPERNVVSWNTIITLYAEDGQVCEALRLFEQMERCGIIPNMLSYVMVISACGSEAALVEGKWIHRSILNTRFASETAVGNALLNMYGKCGKLEDALSMFSNIADRDPISWNSIIAINAQHGQGKQALLLFYQMQEEGINPDNVTFVSMLIACSHSGLVDEGHQCFTSMSIDYHIPLGLDHYICMIDLLGRSGRLIEADKLVSEMPFQPVAGSFLSVLGACRYQADVVRGERAAKFVFELDPDNASPYVMLSNIYEAAGRGDDAAKVMSRIREKRQSACCPVEMNGKVHKFRADQQSYRQRDNICAQ